MPRPGVSVAGHDRRDEKAGGWGDRLPARLRDCPRKAPHPACAGSPRALDRAYGGTQGARTLCLGVWVPFSAATSWLCDRAACLTLASLRVSVKGACLVTGAALGGAEEPEGVRGRPAARVWASLGSRWPFGRNAEVTAGPGR